MEVDISGTKEGEYVCDSNEALEFKLVRSVEDLEDDSVNFKPELSHQIFGDSESVFGYKDLRMKLYYSACRLNMYLGLEYSSIIDPKIFGGLQPDNVQKLLRDKLKIPGVLTNIDEFVKALKDDDSFQPFGEKLSSFTVEKDNCSKHYELYHCDTSNQKFLNFHERLQTFILFYIDAASYIDVDDPKWQFFVVYERFKSKSGSTNYAVAGYCTVYEYYAYPDRTRPRISQVLVLPPFQRLGLGARLLCAVYQHYQGQDTVTDITVEDPNDEFQHLRDYVDTCLCSRLNSFAADKLRQGFTTAMAAEACSKYKINKKQARRIYEILRLKATNIHDKNEYSSFRLDVKRRLNIPFQKETTLMKKLTSLKPYWLKPNEDPADLLKALGLKTTEQRFEILERMFVDTEKEYETILARIEERPLPNDML